jgi:hypothetical protein
MPGVFFMKYPHALKKRGRIKIHPVLIQYSMKNQMFDEMAMPLVAMGTVYYRINMLPV